MAMTRRSIPVYEYVNDLETSGENTSKYINRQIGLINNIISAKIVRQNFGDPVPTVVCELNDNNMEVVKTSRLMYMQSFEGEVAWKTKFTILKIDYDTTNKTMTITGEVVLNNMRNRIWLVPLPEDYLAGTTTSVPRPYRSFGLRKHDDDPPYYVVGNVIVPNAVDRVGRSVYRFSPANKNGLTRIGGSKGSILDIFGGEFDKTQSESNVYHYKKLGRYDETRVLNASLNASGIKYSIDVSEVVNGVVHYIEWKPTGSTPSAPPKQIFIKPYEPVYDVGEEHLLVSRLADKEYRHGQMIAVNWGEQTDLVGDPNELGEAQIRANMIRQANIWNSANKYRSLPVETLTFDFNSIRKTEDYELFQYLLELRIGDTVKINIPELQKVLVGRISGYVYDVLADTYDNITIGSSVKSIIDKIN